MRELIQTAKQIANESADLPFSAYSSVMEQRILNVPVVKPLLICVLDGSKAIGEENELSCGAGNFIFLSNSPNTSMRNIPDIGEYFALLVEFEYEDFDCLSSLTTNTERYCIGEIGSVLKNTLIQFVENTTYAPPEIWRLRRQEILQVISHLGYKAVNAIMAPPSLSHKLHNIIKTDVSVDWNANTLSSMLAMSESTLHRKLSVEGINLQTIKDRAKLGHGLHLIQTSFDSVSHVAEQCGYQSQSRFSEKFKQLFGITPSQLRKTRVRD